MLEQQNFQRALAYFEASILQNDDNAWAWHGKGDAHQWLGDYKESLYAYEQASVRSPTEGLHWGGCANAQYGLKEYTTAYDLRNKTLTLNPALQWMFNNWDDAQ